MWMKKPAWEATVPLDERFEVDAAVQLLARNPLDLQILERLVGRPRRFSDLRARLPVKNDTDLTRALRRLRELVLIDQRGDFSKQPVVRTYEINPLGISVLFTVARIQTINQSIEVTRAVLEAKQRLAADA